MINEKVPHKPMGGVVNDQWEPSSPRKTMESRKKWQVQPDIMLSHGAKKQHLTQRIFTGIALDCNLNQELRNNTPVDPLLPPRSFIEKAEKLDMFGGNLHIGVKQRTSDAEYNEEDFFLGDYIIAPNAMPDNEAKQIQAEYKLTNLITGHEAPDHFENVESGETMAASGGM